MSGSEILYCKKCDVFTMKKICGTCQQKTGTTKPAKYSPEDPHGKYRRIFKKQQVL